MRGITLVLVGPHASGKSTLGRLLAEKLGWIFHDEIGERLRREVLSQDPSQHAMVGQPSFDERVTVEELLRDRQSPMFRVVETWHPGNLAYARARSPSSFRHLYDQVKETFAINRSFIVVQPLQISLKTLSTRIHEPGPEGDDFLLWLLRVGQDASDIAGELGLDLLPAIWTDGVPLSELCKIVLDRVGCV